MFLDDADAVAKILGELVAGSEKEQLLAYQIAFSLHENEIQAFLNKVNEKLPAADAAAAAPAATDGMDTEEKKEGEEEKKKDEPAASPLKLLRSVLSGELPVGLHLEFLFSHNAADLLLLKQIRTRWSLATACATPPPCCATRSCTQAPPWTPSCAKTSTG